MRALYAMLALALVTTFSLFAAELSGWGEIPIEEMPEWAMRAPEKSFVDEQGHTRVLVFTRGESEEACREIVASRASEFLERFVNASGGQTVFTNDLYSRDGDEVVALIEVRLIPTSRKSSGKGGLILSIAAFATALVVTALTW